jgi:uncharacterized protein YecE (DUF72 family)
VRPPARVCIGTSGWHYRHWKGCFYPEELPSAGWLPYYAGLFHSVEVNNSFYHLPPEDSLDQWRDAVPDDFVFSVKASRYISHMKKLKDPSTTLPPFLERVTLLGDKLGPILIQLPSHWHLDILRLRDFLQSLDDRYRYAFEFRDPGWFDDRVYAALAEHQAAFCIFDLNRQLSPLEVTADFVYVRLHGPDGPYQGCYDNRALSRWVKRIRDWQDSGKPVHCYFDNDEKGYAPQNALTMQQMLNV